MMKRFWIIPLMFVALTGCDRDMMSEKGFALPEGDVATGRDAFMHFQCYECHSVKGEEFPDVPGLEPYVELGGKVTRVKTYGELVTAIINPSHRLASRYAAEVVAIDGQSKMAVYNNYMTITELVDIVMYLQPYYDVVVPARSYRIYP